MDPNEQEMDENLMKANDVEAQAKGAEKAGDFQKAEELNEKAVEMEEKAEQGKIDTESQINEANVDARSG